MQFEKSRAPLDQLPAMQLFFCCVHVNAAAMSENETVASVATISTLYITTRPSRTRLRMIMPQLGVGEREKRKLIAPYRKNLQRPITRAVSPQRIPPQRIPHPPKKSCRPPRTRWTTQEPRAAPLTKSLPEGRKKSAAPRDARAGSPLPSMSFCAPIGLLLRRSQ